jgi:hypothetical protein
VPSSPCGKPTPARACFEFTLNPQRLIPAPAAQVKFDTVAPASVFSAGEFADLFFKTKRRAWGWGLKAWEWGIGGWETEALAGDRIGARRRDPLHDGMATDFDAEGHIHPGCL